MSHTQICDSQPLNKRFAHLLGNPEHADFWFHIKEDGSRIPVHKLIVGACSHVLHNIVYGANSEFVLPVDHSEVDEISRSAFMEVLRYMYTDKPEITNENVVVILRKANYFGLDLLQKICLSHMLKNVNTDSCLSLFAELYDCIPFNDVVKKCWCLIEMQPQLAAFNKPEWPEIDREAVCYILSSPRINCDEYALFEAMLKWLKAQDPSVPPNELKDFGSGIDQYIRFTCLSIPEFERIVALEPAFFSEDEKTRIFHTIRDGKSSGVKREKWFWDHARWIELEADSSFPTDALYIPVEYAEGSSYVARIKSAHLICSYMPYYGSVNEDDIYIDHVENKVEVLCGSGYEWVTPENGMLPENMVLTGMDEGDTIIARCLTSDQLVGLSVSKWMADNNNKDQAGSDVERDQFQILVGTAIERVYPQNEIPPDALVASTYGSQNHPTYLGRVYYEGDILPAVVVPAENRALSSYDCAERSVDGYTFLRLPVDSFEWVQSQDGDLNAKAVEGGRTRFGETLYFGRALHAGTNTVCYGKVHPSHACMYFGLNGAELNSRSYEVLVHK